MLAMACLTPWAFGSVDGWAMLGILLGTIALALLGLVRGWGEAGTRGAATCLPSLALLGLIALALIQSRSFPERLLARISPQAAGLRTSLFPKALEVVAGSSLPAARGAESTLSLVPEETINTCLALTAAWILFQSVLNLGGGLASFRRFATAIAINAAFLAFFALIQSLSWNGKIYWIRPSSQPFGPWYSGGPFVCHNHLAAYLNLGLGLCIGSLLAAGREPRRTRAGGSWLWYSYAMTLIVVGLLSSHSRGGFVSAVVASLVVLVLWRPRVSRPQVGLLVFLAMAPMLMMAVGSLSPFQRLGTILGRDAFAPRLKIWGQSLSVWRDYPAVGTGLGSFPFAVASYGKVDRGVFYGHAENEYLELLVETGIIGLGIGIAAIAATLRLAGRAFTSTRIASDRLIVLGGLWSLFALLVQCMSDFCLHIPGVAVTALMLIGHLCRLGLRARQTSEVAGADAQVVGPRLAGRAVLLASAVATVAILIPTFRLARAEILLSRGNVPLPGSSVPTIQPTSLPLEQLESMERALKAALAVRPNWAEGHLRLGLTRLDLYRTITDQAIGDQVPDADRRALLSDPFWLYRLAHAGKVGDEIEVDSFLEQEPIRRFILPAATDFLEARRCAPTLALSHAGLATVDYLLEGREPTSVYLERAARLAGADTRSLQYVANLSAMAGDFKLAASCWKRVLEGFVVDWTEVADSATTVLTPEQILRDVIPPRGRYPLWFADRLYQGIASREPRELFLREALVRLPDETDLSETEKLHEEYLIRCRLGEIAKAREIASEMLEREPLQTRWRVEYIDRLCDWGLFKAAREQALVGLQIDPEFPELKHRLDIIADNLARNGQSRSPFIRIP